MVQKLTIRNEAFLQIRGMFFGDLSSLRLFKLESKLPPHSEQLSSRFLLNVADDIQEEVVYENSRKNMHLDAVNDLQ